mmetsp:Transcript_37334/g.42667  ORF Transcript_37334/g.42667 Transcript_37334/m.42667 type:complete len:366 (+) Transcript_37334:3-1100(+)
MIKWIQSLTLVALLLLTVDGLVLPRLTSISSSSLRRSASDDSNSNTATELDDRVTLKDDTIISKQRNDEELTTKKSEWEELEIGYQQVISLEAFDPSYIGSLATIEDIIGIVIHVPLLLLAFQTAFTGQVDATAYAQCALFSFVTSLAHSKMWFDEPRDYRAPRLAEPRSVYQFSTLYLVSFSWLLYRITSLYPQALQGPLDIVGCLALSLITIYGWAYAVFGKGLLKQVNDPSSNYEGTLLPSSEAYQMQAQLYLTGNIVINSLACLFLPFAWTLAIRGTEWWTRVQELHPNQGAFLGVSILVAILGDTSGNLLLRLQQLKVTTSVRALVVMGILSNVVFLLAPEITFNSIYMGGISEVGFYWE